MNKTVSQVLSVLIRVHPRLNGLAKTRLLHWFKEFALWNQ
jgi:hypothetical protein